MPPVIELHAVSKSFPTATLVGPTTTAVENISFAIAPGSLVALLGPSGCGKTTTLRLIAGLEIPDSGEIWLAGRNVAGRAAWTPPEGRGVGMVFQDGALFPHLTVAQNIAFALNGKNGDKPQQARIAELLQLVGLPDLAARYPHQLSGGQQQRIALARALAQRPHVVLLDEPFSRLDAALRTSLRQEVQQIVKASGATTLFVTHDQEEALSIADRIVVMFGGRVAQVGSPQEVYVRPATRQVATFVGDANFLPGTARGHVAECVLGKLLLATPHDGAVEVMLRPEVIEVEQVRDGSARIERIRYFGHDQIADLRLADGQALAARTLPRPELAVGDQVNPIVRGVVMAYPQA